MSKIIEEIKVDQELTEEKLNFMTDVFIKCLVEISKTSSNIDEDAINYIIQILHLKYFTNMDLPDEFNHILAALKPMENEISSIMKQFPEGELQKSLEKIKSTFIEIERQIQELMESSEDASLQ